ncbi:MAG: bifunctional UDP-N-acetylglucosamine diphosphorylase/glucosamine-1-phosphate N-acetyltransferase GlmU [Clostridia bacterium]|nr:bifunctional UDP-N-acetylglucosamine diphosphorylase/glucosamine-1-phosphate N-acetyltransferase GlmU [Clostridia bacterium]
MKNICSFILNENKFLNLEKLFESTILFKSIISRQLSILEKAGCFSHLIIHDDIETIAKYDIDNLTCLCDNDFAADFIKGFDLVIISHGDMPLIESEIIKDAINCHKDGSITVLTNYDRIIKSDCEGSIFILDSKLFNKFLLSSSDIYDFAKEHKKLTIIEADTSFCARIFDNLSLMEIKEAARQKTLYSHCENGVIFEAFDGVIIDDDSIIEEGATILPGTIIKGNSYIKSGAVIGPNSNITDTIIGNFSEIKATYCEKSSIGDNVKIGPFCNIRPDCKISDNVKMGDFVEIKNSQIGENTAVAHLTYVGDSDVGSGVNFGCGTVTVNYDGINKHRTKIGNNVFIGCNTNFIAPVEIEDNTFIAAGSTITKDVPEGAFAIARARQENKPDYAKKFLKK